MQKKSILFIFSAGLILGFFLPRSIFVNSPPVISEQQSEYKLKDLKEKLQKISEEDINEYLQLKEMKAKYEKADEIFEKILKLFLIDLGLRLSEKQLETLKSNRIQPAVTHQPELKVKPMINQVLPTHPNEKTTNSPQNTETFESVSKFLNEKKLNQPLAVWSAAKPVNQETFNLIDGHFTGNIHFTDSDKTSLDLEMELSKASFANGLITGEFFLKTTDPSDPKYRDTTRYEPNSKISNFRLADDGAVLVESMGGDGLFQLYYFAQTNTFHGSLYEKQGLDGFKRTGRIILNRR